MDLKELGKRASGLGAAGLNGLFGSHARQNLGILVYHRIASPVPGIPQPTLNVSPQRFRRQITGLLDRGFVVWPLRKVLQHRAQKQAIPARTVVITFDDVFENVFLNAWPILEEFQVPATLFLSTSYLDSPEPFPFDHWGTTVRARAPVETYRPIRSLQCRQVADTGLVELGAHTHTHADFRGRPDAFRQDLLTCVEALGRRFGCSEVTFAFPFGRLQQGFVDSGLMAAAREAGVLCGLTTESVLVDPQSDPFQWGRFNVYEWDTGCTLAAKLEGWYSWAPKLQDWFSEALRRNHANPDGAAANGRTAGREVHRRSVATRSASERFP